MNLIARIGVIAAVTFVAALAVVPRETEAATLALIENGDFEAGSLAGWVVADQEGGSGTFFATDAAVSPLSAYPTAGAASGDYYAVSDQNGPGAHVLAQSFTVPAGCTVTAAFDMFVNDQSLVGPEVNPAGLDYTASPNQHARVDIVSEDDASSEFDTGAAVVQNLYLGIDAGELPRPYTHYSFDISDAVEAGGTFWIRFAEVDDLFFFNQGVDNVSVTADCNDVDAKSLQFHGIFLLLAHLELGPYSDGLQPGDEEVTVDLGNGQRIVFPAGNLDGSRSFATGATLFGGKVAQIWLIQLWPGHYVMLVFGYGADWFDDDEISVSIGNDGWVGDDFGPDFNPTAEPSVAGAPPAGDPASAY